MIARSNKHFLRVYDCRYGPVLDECQKRDHSIMGFVPQTTLQTQPCDAEGFGDGKGEVANIKVARNLIGDQDRYVTANVWVHAIKSKWYVMHYCLSLIIHIWAHVIISPIITTCITHRRKRPLIQRAFKKTGLMPFTRTAHLEINRADIQLGDALIEAEKMMERQRKREKNDASAITSSMTNVDVTPTPTPTELRQTEISDISKIFGDMHIQPDKGNTHGLKMWPKYEITTRSPAVWKRCIELSPQLKARFNATDRVELLKFFEVGLLLEEQLDNLVPEQALILG